MKTENNDAETRFRRIMTDAARRIPRGDDPPYSLGMDLMGNLMPVCDADFAGAAYEMWGGLTDGIDGPPRCDYALSISPFPHRARRLHAWARSRRGVRHPL
ncbi:hypothetical protein GCM10009661_55620 [Catellatospora chokoriensis]|uniref:Uncharacterized protein n=1 Tax=Catellatospora chokoriensis TaxID=310353 RepID=A0A8J3NRX4_9ACTN|nr:hypothetical protein Cch02nite_33950 [Catellatospora chokoriensis]